MTYGRTDGRTNPNYRKASILKTRMTTLCLIGLGITFGKEFVKFKFYLAILNVKSINKIIKDWKKGKALLI